MRTEPDQLKRLLIRFAINQNEIGAYVAIAKVLPLACERVIPPIRRQRRIGSQDGDDFRKIGA